MNLTLDPKEIVWPQTHYVYVEKPAPFMQNAQRAWQELHAALRSWPGTPPTHFFSAYKLKPVAFYRAGFATNAKPESLPPGLSYDTIPTGRYAQFTLTGSYMNLPEACARVEQRVKELGIQVGAGFYIEDYLGDPKTTPEPNLVTHLNWPL